MPRATGATTMRAVGLTGTLLLAAGLAGAPGPPADARPEEAAVARVLDDWHAAAAAADEARYFGQMTEDAVFLGTDPGERWTKEQFRAYAHPHFAKGKAWSFRPVRRSVSVSADRTVAWFDEDLATPNLGPCRGSGVLVRDGPEWKIVQYNLSVPIPNGIFAEVRRLIAQSGAARP